jgi:hypothetical protein
VTAKAKKGVGKALQARDFTAPPAETGFAAGLA